MVILVTGVSSGFGLETAKALVARGHIVYGTVRREVEKLPGLRYLNVDVRDDAQVKEAVDTVIREQGRIDVLVNNAGMGIGGPIEFAPIEDVHTQMDINFMGLVRCVKAVLPHMRRQGSGRIVAFSSIGGLMGLPFQGYYSASKFAIEGFCEALRLEVKPDNIKVVVIEPGDFHTGFTGKRKKEADPEAAKAYPTYAESMASIEHDETTGLTPEYLAARLVRIIEKKNPSYSYIISTFVQRLSVTLKHILPAPLFAGILGSYYKL